MSNCGLAIAFLPHSVPACACVCLRVSKRQICSVENTGGGGRPLLLLLVGSLAPLSREESERRDESEWMSRRL